MNKMCSEGVTGAHAEKVKKSYRASKHSRNGGHAMQNRGKQQKKRGDGRGVNAGDNPTCRMCADGAEVRNPEEIAHDMRSQWRYQGVGSRKQSRRIKAEYQRVN